MKNLFEKVEGLPDLINSEGAILNIVKKFDEKFPENLYLQGQLVVNNDYSKIICKTKVEIIKLYLESQIKLIDVYLNTLSPYYIIVYNSNAIISENQISLINLNFGMVYYSEINTSLTSNIYDILNYINLASY
jgi:hypothetical protein